MAAVKAKEKEMKDEKEAERQVSIFIKNNIDYQCTPYLTFFIRGGYKP